MGTKTVKLTFLRPVHFGQSRLSDGGSTCDAATLFSALFIEALRDGAQDGLLEAARDGDLAISDALPYVGDTLYLPKPMVAPDVFDRRNREREAAGERLDSRERKANKRLAYVPARRYGDYLAGTFDSLAEQGSFKLGTSQLQTKVNLTREESEDSLPYFVDGYSFVEGAGLYFLVRGGYDIAPLLDQLSYAGLGGKRSSGYGRFAYEICDSDPTAEAASSIAAEARTGSHVLLSTSLPHPDELGNELLAGARYRLVRKGGFVQSATHAASPQKKRDLYLFAAGSTFARTFEGDVYDVNDTPGAHPVYRYAKALWMEV